MRRKSGAIGAAASMKHGPIGQHKGEPAPSISHLRVEKPPKAAEVAEMEQGQHGPHIRAMPKPVIVICSNCWAIYERSEETVPTWSQGSFDCSVDVSWRLGVA